MTSKSEVDPALSGAWDLALAGLREITPDATIGEPAGYTVEEDGVVSLRFENRLSGYPGWFWTVSVGRAPDAEPTVLEVELLPGGDALLAPEWVPWAVRLAEYQAAQAAAAEAEGDEVEDEADDADDDDGEEEDVDDLDDLDVGDFDTDGSPILHAGDVDGVDIDELADPDDADRDEDDDDRDEDDDDEDGVDDDDEDGVDDDEEADAGDSDDSDDDEVSTDPDDGP